MGRKLPKKHGYKRSSEDNSRNIKFPNCIGRYPECRGYTADMNIEDRSECKSCPFK